MKSDLAELLDRAAAREGIKKSAIVERALRRELEAYEMGDGRTRLTTTLPREAVADLMNRAAVMDRRPDELIAALIRVHLPSLTDREVDPETWLQEQRERARRILDAA